MAANKECGITDQVLDPFTDRNGGGLELTANCAIGCPVRANSMMRRRYSGVYGIWVLGIGGPPSSFLPNTVYKTELRKAGICLVSKSA